MWFSLHGVAAISLSLWPHQSLSDFQSLHPLSQERNTLDCSGHGLRLVNIDSYEDKTVCMLLDLCAGPPPGYPYPNQK